LKHGVWRKGTTWGAGGRQGILGLGLSEEPVPAFSVAEHGARQLEGITLDHAMIGSHSSMGCEELEGAEHCGLVRISESKLISTSIGESHPLIQNEI
jgi:hypothetical protein